MASTLEESNSANLQLRIRRLGISSPLQWLNRGLQDIKANPLPSLAYGLLFGIGGDLILLASLGQARFFTFAISAFFLVAPLLAAGLYEISRRRQTGERIGFIDSLAPFRNRGSVLTQFGLVLALVVLLWDRISYFAFRQLEQATGLDVSHFPSLLSALNAHPDQLALWVIVGGMLALATFIFSMVAIPLLLDRPATLGMALHASLMSFLANPLPLLAWAWLIVALTMIGFASFLFGLVIIMPLLGHASWHAYRDLVE